MHCLHLSCSLVRRSWCQVGTVYNSDNIWANVQDSGHPWDINWHLGDASAWKPFFGPILPLRELASIQVTCAPPSVAQWGRAVACQ